MKRVILSLILALTTSCCHLFQLDTADVIEVGAVSVVRVKTATGYCSGFALDSSTIVTAAHCVSTPNAYIEWGSKVILGVVVAADVTNDVAIIKSLYPADGLIGLMPRTAKLRRGDQLVTVAFPGWANVQNAFELGVVIDSDENVILTLDSCLPGDSGGAVLDVYGQVVGLCSRVSPRIAMYPGSEGLEHSHRDVAIVIPIQKALDLL